jgi:hypothetical protein
MTFGGLTSEAGDGSRVGKPNSPLGLRAGFDSPRQGGSKNWLHHVDFGGRQSIR